MTPERVRELLEEVARGATAPADALETLRELPFADLGHTMVDHHRELRTGMPEAVYGSGKSPGQLVEILRRLEETHGRALATRVSRRKAQRVQEDLPAAQHDPVSRLLTIGGTPQRTAPASVAVACAGTSDLPVAEEAAGTLEFLGHPVERLTDVGVAGVHRLFDRLETLRRAQVVICVAGMEGALTSVIGGLVAAPVIGVPTSVGYGVAKGGETALRAMLTSCASGVAVVNIDNGFGAATVAHAILTGSKSADPLP